MAHSLQAIEIDGQLIWVETEALAAPADDDKFASTARRGLTERTTDALTQVDLRTVLHTVIGHTRAAVASLGAEEVSVELALGFKADVGVFIASGEASAQIKVAAKWKPAKG